MNAYVIITTSIVAGVLISAAISLRFCDRLERAFKQYVPAPGNDVEQRVLNEDGGSP